MSTAPDAALTARHFSLNGVPVFVTGGAAGIGADIVRAFAAQGAKVGFVDAFFAAQAVMPGMQRGGGVIVNVGAASWLMKSADH